MYGYPMYGCGCQGNDGLGSSWWIIIIVFVIFFLFWGSGSGRGRPDCC